MIDYKDKYLKTLNRVTALNQVIVNLTDKVDYLRRENGVIKENLKTERINTLNDVIASLSYYSEAHNTFVKKVEKMKEDTLNEKI